MRTYTPFQPRLSARKAANYPTMHLAIKKSNLFHGGATHMRLDDG